MPEWKTPLEKIEIGKGRKLKDGKDIAILSFRHPGNFVQTAIRNLRPEGIDPAHLCLGSSLCLLFDFVFELLECFCWCDFLNEILMHDS